MKTQLTKDEIRKMEPGREMNLAIVRGIFNWPEHSPDYQLGDLEQEKLLNFGEDARAAIGLIGALVTLGWEYTARYEKREHVFGFYRPEWVTSNLYAAIPIETGKASTFPLAVARAALLAYSDPMDRVIGIEIRL